MTWFYYLIAAGFGLIFGSFFNVCIYRIPIGMSLGNRSICPRCEKQIAWYDNIPLLSFIILRGRCRGCREPISWRYPLVEALTAVLFVVTYWWSTSVVPDAIGVDGGAFVPELFIGLLLGSIVLIISFADIDHGMIPNVVVFPGIALMFALVVALAVYRGEPIRIAAAVATGVGSSIVLFGISFIHGLIRLKGREEPVEGDEEEEGRGSRFIWKGGKDFQVVDAAEENDKDDSNGDEDEDDEDGDDEVPLGMGFGDFKLVLIIGLGLGYFNWFFIFFAIIAASLTALIIAIYYQISMQRKIPFGPFLAFGAMVALYFGPYLYELLVSY